MEIVLKSRRKLRPKASTRGNLVRLNADATSIIEYLAEQTDQTFTYVASEIITQAFESIKLEEAE